MHNVDNQIITARPLEAPPVPAAAGAGTLGQGQAAGLVGGKYRIGAGEPAGAGLETGKFSEDTGELPGEEIEIVSETELVQRRPLPWVWIGLAAAALVLWRK